MKQKLSLLLVLALLLSCFCLTAAAEEPFRFTRENFPVLDGSTSMVPLGQAIASVLLGESRESVEPDITFYRTTQSFYDLMYGQCSVVLAAEPKAEVFQTMRENAFPYLMETIAKEALVFVVNADNPVNSLTTEQVRGIYAGTITNWKEVGGEDAPIAAFQRNPTAGSQVMMEKLVMDGTPMMEAPSSMLPTEMEGLIKSVRSYDNTANAIGYTVFYYASDMQMAKGLKILKIDGCLPSPDTIRSGEYPFINGYYCCINAMEASDSPARRLFNWLVSDEGQALLTLEGYVSVSAPGEAPSRGDDVYVDYTAYTPSSSLEAVFTNFDCPHDRIVARDDYGLIYPYEGGRAYAVWNDGQDDFENGYFQGFFNARGQLITAPIFTVIYPCKLGDSDYIWFVSANDSEGGFVSKDGSFVSELCYQEAFELGSYIMAIRDRETGLFDLYDSSFRIVKTQDDFQYNGKNIMPMEYVNGLYCGSTPYEPYNDTMTYVLMDEDGNVLMESERYMYLYNDGIIETYDDEWNSQLFTSDLKPITCDEIQDPTNVYRLNSNFFHIYTASGSEHVIDRDGNLFAQDVDAAYAHMDDTFHVEKDGLATVYSERGQMLYSGIDAEEMYVGNGIFSRSDDPGLTITKYPEGKTLFVSDGIYADLRGGLLFISCTDNNDWYTRVADQDLNLRPNTYPGCDEYHDMITDDHYLVFSDSFGFYGNHQMMDLTLEKELLNVNGSVTIMDGFITATTDRGFTCYSPDGTIIFSYPFYGLSNGD